jgi:hypothetical protein
MLRKSIRTVPLLLLVAVSACGPSGGEHGGHGALGSRHNIALPLMHRAMRMGMHGAMRMGMRSATRQHGFRRACEADVAKLCSGLSSKRQERQCLEGKRDLVSADCREALEHRRERSNENSNQNLR